MFSRSTDDPYMLFKNFADSHYFHVYFRKMFIIVWSNLVNLVTILSFVVSVTDYFEGINFSKYSKCISMIFVTKNSQNST